MSGGFSISDVAFSPMVPPAAIAAGLVFAGILIGVRFGAAGWRRGVLSWLPRVLMLTLLAAMLLRPAIPAETPLAAPTNADVYFVIDTTSSIGALDWNGGEPRLAGIRADVRALVGELAGARFSVIGFDGIATVRVPLTTDAAAVVTALDVARPETSVYGRGSSIGLAAPLLREELDRAANESQLRARVVYYFGDGEQTVAGDPESFASSAALIGGGAVFGYGSAAGAPMPVFKGASRPTDELIVDPGTGAPALSAIDEGTLKAVATQLGVPYELRDPASPVGPGDLHVSSVDADGSLSRTSVFELYWVAALGIVGLLAIEFSRLGWAMFASRLRSPPARRRSAR